MRTICRTLVALAAAVAVPAMAQTTQPIVAVAHVDFIPDNLAQGLPALQQFAQQSRSDPGVWSFTLITWAPTTNHFQLVGVFSSLAAYQNHVQSPHTIAFRAAIQPSIGALYDERIYALGEVPGQR